MLLAGIPLRYYNITFLLCYNYHVSNWSVYVCALLAAVVVNKVEDVRSVIQYYNQYDDPMAKFRENQVAVQVCMVCSTNGIYAVQF